MGKRTRPGMRVKRWRVQQVPRMSQRALGAKVGLSGDAIRHFENTGKTISFRAKIELCELMGCPVSWLLGKSELQTAYRIHDLIDKQVA